MLETSFNICQHMLWIEPVCECERGIEGMLMLLKRQVDLPLHSVFRFSLRFADCATQSRWTTFFLWKSTDQAQKEEQTTPAVCLLLFIMMSSQSCYCTYHKHRPIALWLASSRALLDLSFMLLLRSCLVRKPRGQEHILLYSRGYSTETFVEHMAAGSGWIVEQ